MRRAIGFRSVMVVPLRAHDRLLGALTFARGSSREPFEAEDLALAAELARHCALAMDNARLYGEVRQALQARDTFLSVAAHELKTRMTSVFGATQLLRRQVEQEPVLDLARLHARVDLVHQQANKLVRLLHQLLDVSRIEAGQLSLERVLTNLLENAMKFSPHGGTIEVGWPHDRTGPSNSACAITAWESHPRPVSGSSIASIKATRTSTRRAWAWVCGSAARSWPSTVGGSRSSLRRTEALGSW